MEEVSSGLGAQEPLWGGLDRLPRLDGAAAAGYWRCRALAGCDGDDGEEQERRAQRGLPKVSAVGPTRRTMAARSTSAESPANDRQSLGPRESGRWTG